MAKPTPGEHIVRGGSCPAAGFASEVEMLARQKPMGFRDSHVVKVLIGWRPW